MPSKNLDHFKPLFFLGVFLLSWWSLPVFFKRFTQVCFFEFQAPTWIASSYLDDIQSYWSMQAHSKSELIEAGRDLARLNATYRLKLQLYESNLQAIKDFESIFNLPPLPEYRVEMARVIKRDFNAWTQQMVIQKGRNQGIAEGAAVIYAGGVVGRIKTVYANTSVVELSSSKSFRVASHVQGDPRPITYQGKQGILPFSLLGEIKHVPMDIQLSEESPLYLVSSSFGGVFPDGLVIGKIIRLEPGSDGLFQRGHIELDLRLLELREVAVLIRIMGDEA